MSSLRRTRSGGWEVRYRDPGGRQRGRSFAKRADALRFRSECEVAIGHGTWVDPGAGRMLLGDWAAAWRSTLVGLRPATLARHDMALRNYVLPTFGATPLAAVTQLGVQAWVAELAKRLAPRTVAAAYSTLKVVLAAAVDAGVLGASPCVRVRKPRVDEGERRYLTPLEVARLAGEVPERWRALVLLGAYGGLRIGELTALRQGRLHLLNGTVEVVEQATEVRGHLVLSRPKTKAGVRSVPIPRPVCEALGAHLAAFGNPESGLCFPTAAGGMLKACNWRDRTWHPAVRRAGLAPLVPHELRHTAVALWIASGATPLEVARRAGHTKVAFTLDTYGHLFDAQVDQTTERLGAMYVGEAVEGEVHRLAP